MVFTYNGARQAPRRRDLRRLLQSIVVDEHFVLRVPANLDPAGAAPLLCAGITTYSPLRHWKVGKGKKVGIVGLGGLGHMGVKFATPSARTSSSSPPRPSKAADALRLGADEVVVSRDADAMAKHAGSFDFILDTVSADHDLNAYLGLLKLDGTLTLVGAPAEAAARRQAFGLIMGRKPRRLAHRRHRRDAGDARLLRQAQHHRRRRGDPIHQINEAYERMLKSDVKYRFVIDMASRRSGATGRRGSSSASRPRRRAPPASRASTAPRSRSGPSSSTATCSPACSASSPASTAAPSS
jgi:uncharacterized zinc-type alcohol dehydrogenase-like protein